MCESAVASLVTSVYLAATCLTQETRTLTCKAKCVTEVKWQEGNVIETLNVEKIFLNNVLLRTKVKVMLSLIVAYI